MDCVAGGCSCLCCAPPALKSDCVGGVLKPECINKSAVDPSGGTPLADDPVQKYLKACPVRTSIHETFHMLPGGVRREMVTGIAEFVNCFGHEIRSNTLRNRFLWLRYSEQDFD